MEADISEIDGQLLYVSLPDAWAEPIVVAADGIGHGKAAGKAQTTALPRATARICNAAGRFLQAGTAATNESVLS